MKKNCLVFPFGTALFLLWVKNQSFFFFFFFFNIYLFYLFIWLFLALAAACGIKFPNQGLNPGPLHWEHRVLAAGPPGKSQESVVLMMGLWPCESTADGLLNVSSQLTASGFARYELFKSTALDDIVAASQTTITLDISWSPVDEILQTPPLSSTAALVGATPPFC